VALLAAALLGWWLLGGGPGTGSVVGDRDGQRVGETPMHGESTAPGTSPLLRGTADAELPRESEGETAAAAHEASDTIVVTGRVVDDRRIPVADIEVVADRPGYAVARSRTDTDGRFELRLLRPPAHDWESLTLVARRGEGQVGALDIALHKDSPGSLDAGTLVLLEGASLDLRVEDSQGSPVAADVLLVPWRPVGGGVCARARAGADGCARLPALPPAIYRVVAHAVGYARALAVTEVPRQGRAPLLLRLGPKRDVDLLVVAQGTDEPVVGASIQVWEEVRGAGWVSQGIYVPVRDVAETDAAGRTRLEDLAEEDEVILLVSAAGYTHTSLLLGGTGVRPVLAAGVREARIDLPRLRTVTVPVTDREGPVPEDGTVLTLRSLAGGLFTPLPGTAHVVDGRIEVAGVGAGIVQGLATAPDGGIAWLRVEADATVGQETSFRLPRTIRVHVTHPDGSACPGLYVQVRTMGSLLLHDPVRLDADGRAVLTRLWGRGARVYVAERADEWPGILIGSADLQAGDAVVEGTVARRRAGLLRVRIDGEPRLPALYLCELGTESIQVTGEDPARGEIHFRWRPGTPGTKRALRFRAPDYVLREEPAPLTGEGGEPDVVDIRLESGATLVARVRLPEDGRVDLELERWDPDASTWSPYRDGLSPDLGIDPSGRQRFISLPEGRYRVACRATGLASQGVNVHPGGPPVEVALDLGSVGYARGHVEVPEGYDVRDVDIQASGLPEGANELAAHGVGRVGDDARFSVRIPGTSAVTLRPVHPSLVPAAEGGEVTVTKPCDGLVLRLVESDSATFRLEPEPIFPPYVDQGTVGIRLYAGDVTGDPVLSVQAPYTEEGVRFGRFSPGTYTLWVDAPGFEPAILSGVTLVEGDNDLGMILLSPGARIVVHVLLPEGWGKPAVTVIARKEEPPSYARVVTSRGEADVTLRGLGRGRFLLLTWMLDPPQGTRPLHETIEVDGEETIERTLDLR